MTVRRVYAASVALVLAGSLAGTGAAAAEDDPAYDRHVRVEEEPETRREIEWVGIRSGIGYAAYDLTTFVADDQNLTADFVPTRFAGPAANLSAGVRLWFVTLAARGSLAYFSDEMAEGLYLWSVGGEALFHLLSGFPLEPYLLLGGGYAALNGVEDAVPGLEGQYRVRGYNARAGLGLDYHATRYLSIGMLVSAEALFLTRPGVSALDLMTPEQVETVGEARARVLEGDGSSVGGGFSVLVGPGLHF